DMLFHFLTVHLCRVIALFTLPTALLTPCFLGWRNRRKHPHPPRTHRRKLGIEFAIFAFKPVDILWRSNGITALALLTRKRPILEHLPNGWHEHRTTDHPSVLVA